MRHTSLRRRTGTTLVRSTAILTVLCVAPTLALTSPAGTGSAFALPCPDGSQTCGPQPGPTMTLPTQTPDPGETGGRGGSPTGAQTPDILPTGQGPDAGNSGNHAGPNAAAQTPDDPGTGNGTPIVDTQPTVTKPPQRPATPTASMPQQTQETQSPAHQTQTPATDRSWENDLRRKCSEALAQLHAEAIPTVVGGGPGRSRITFLHPQDPGTPAVCTDCANQAMNEFINNLNKTPIANCRTTSGPVYQGQKQGTLMAGPGKLGAVPQTLTFSVNTTNDSQKVTSTNSNTISGGAGIELGPLKANGSAETSGSVEVVAPTSGVGTTKTGSATITPKELFPNTPLTELSNYPLEMVQNLSKFGFTYSCTTIDGVTTGLRTHEVDVVSSVDVIVVGPEGPITLYSMVW